MTAIQTYYLSATNTKPARIMAKTMDSRHEKITVSYNSIDKQSQEDIHGEVVKRLCEKLGWDFFWQEPGGTANGYVWTFTKNGSNELKNILTPPLG